MRVYRWVLAFGLGLCGCGVEVSDTGTAQGSIRHRWRDDGGADGGTAYADAGWPAPQPGMPDPGYYTPIGPVLDAGTGAPSNPAPPPVAPDAGAVAPYPEYPPAPVAPDAGTGTMPAPIQLHCSGVIWTFANPYANFADYAVYYSLTTETDGSTRVSCVVEHRAAPRNDTVALVRQGTASGSATERTPDCSPEPGWVFTRYSNGIGVSYSTTNASGSILMNCRGY